MTDINKEGAQIFASSEIMGAALTANMSKSDTLSFTKDPKSFIFSSLDTDTGDISLLVVENDSGTINLALPYYSMLERISAEAVNELDMDVVSGGEILISIFAIGGLAAVAAATAAASGVGAMVVGGVVGGAVGAAVVTGVAVAGAAGYKSSKGENLDGSSK